MTLASGLAAGAVAGVLLVASGCGGGSKKVPTSFGAINGTQTRYQMVLDTDDGSVIELDDGSLWAVANADQLRVLQHWSLDSNLVEVGKDGHTLINAEAADTNNVSARRIGFTSTHELYTHTGDDTLAGIGHGEYFNGTADGSIVTLGDGSIWYIADANDQEVVVDWADGDDVVVSKTGKPGLQGQPYKLDDTDVSSSVTGIYVGGYSAKG